MEYEKQNFKDGQVLVAEQLNLMEEGIASAHEMAGSANDRAKDLQQRMDTLVDDSTIGTGVWSSKNIVDKLCPSLNETGTVVSCEPVEDYPLEVISEIPVTEDGITHCTLIHRSGENLLGSASYVQGSYSAYGVHWTINEDKSITISTDAGGCKGDVKIPLIGGGANGLEPVEIASVGIVQGERYTIYPGVKLPTYTYMRLKFCDADGNEVSEARVSYASTTGKNNFSYGKTQKIYGYLHIDYGAIITEPVTIYPMFVRGNAVIDYVPPQYDEFAVEFDEPVITGGKYNWTSGLLTFNGDNINSYDPIKIKAKCGRNILSSETDWGDTTYTTVIGKKDPAVVIAKLEASVNALLGV